MFPLHTKKTYPALQSFGLVNFFGGDFPSWAASASSEMSRVICDAISMCACSVSVILMFIPKKGGTIVEPFSWLLHLISFFIQLAQVNQTKIWRGIALHLRNEGVKQTKAYPSKRWFTTANQETTTITTPYVNKSKLVRLFQAWNLSFPEDNRKNLQ